jgi:hypothetical protein
MYLCSYVMLTNLLPLCSIVHILIYVFLAEINNELKVRKL